MTTTPPSSRTGGGPASGASGSGALLRLADPRSLRWKISAVVASAACAMALGIGVLVHKATEDRSTHVSKGYVLRELETALAVAERRPRPSVTEPAREPAPEPPVDPAAHPTLEALPDFGTGEDLPEGLLEELRQVPENTPVTWYETGTRHGPWMWAAQRVDGQVLATNMHMGSQLRSIEALDRHVRYAAMATLAVVVPLTLLAAELVLRRLRRVAGTARRIKGGDLDARTYGRGGDEIAEISSAVDLMADALRDRLLGEQRFTADVAHELRTPLAGLVASASLLPECEATALVRDRVHVLHGLVDDLLEISRLDAGTEEADLRPVPVGDLVAESVERAGLDARVTVTGGPVAVTDPRRLDRVVTNLLVNAARHGAGPVEVTVTATGGGTTALVVRDHGPGFPADLLAHGPQRFRTGTAERGRGHGLGLTIAVGQSEVIGARLTLTNATARGPAGAASGAVATLVLPRRTAPVRD
ncbi:HAMP domain-containing sensor histidine kinase [Streptomyces sp. NPDC094049]|uniref:HAMP domain-containing sensor histidine kinase n=1 Tax=Streptomyces sp. NPDC094049 TaxID=3154987 RepID=UPI00331DAB35